MGADVEREGKVRRSQMFHADTAVLLRFLAGSGRGARSGTVDG